MELNLTQDRHEAHVLLDLLSAEKLDVVRSLLEVLVEPLSLSLALAPVDEEELTEEMAAQIERARHAIEKGEGIAHSEILAEFGLPA